MSQADLAAETGLEPSNISHIEAGRRDPRSSTLERIADGLGARLIAVHTHGQRLIADAPETIDDWLRRGDEGAALAYVARLVQSLQGKDAVTVLTIALAPPRSINPEWDALLAGIAEWQLDAVGAPLPAWVTEPPGRDHQDWWAPASAPAVNDVDRADVPQPLLDRGVMLSRVTLLQPIEF